jgi:hypothetical protein
LFSDRQPSTEAVESELSTNRAQSLNQIVTETAPSRPIYPYSVIAGGVQDAKELKWVAEHDPVVAAHYAGFDYNHARIVQLTLARTVYLSYRIGNRVYWTRRRIALHKGEKLLTDGRMTARTRCANRVEEAPQQESVSPSEPPAHKFDEPMRPGEGTAMQSPGTPFESALLHRPTAPGIEPAAPLSLYDPFVGGNVVPLSPPPLPIGLCAPAKKGSTAAAATSAGKKKTGACGVPTVPEVVPEPATWILFISGLAVIFWEAQRKLARARF